jgi:hypothetical protein
MAPANALSFCVQTSLFRTTTTSRHRIAETTAAGLSDGRLSMDRPKNCDSTWQSLALIDRVDEQAIGRCAPCGRSSGRLPTTSLVTPRR